MDSQNNFNNGTGGGFLAESNTQQQNTNRRDLNAQTIRPVTIKQLHHLEEPMEGEANMLDNREVTLVRLVAILRDAAFHSTNFTFTFEDGTGKISGRMLRPSDEQIDEKQKQYSEMTHKYVEVVADLRFYQKKLNLTLHSLKLVQDFNQVTFHICEVTKVHLKFTRGNPSNTNNHAVNQTRQINDSDLNTHGYSTATATDNNVAAVSSHPEVTQQILAFIKAATQDAKGVPCASVCQFAKQLGYDDARSRALIVELENEGKIFYTLEDCVATI